MKASPTVRSLKLLRDRGYLVAIVEKFVRFPPPGHRVDLWGFVDLLAIKAGEITAVQTTSGANVSARLKKIAASPHIATVLSAGVRVVVHGWSKKGPRGKAKKWECREELLTAEHFPNMAQT